CGYVRPSVGKRHAEHHIAEERRCAMLWTITVILLVLWVLGLVSGASIGAWVHILLVLAVISLIFAVLRRGTGAAVP
ncbi:MAG: lmo0937 family membrane protein, partial [Myxococcales bacterium]